jgi:hypothetical protein
VLFDGLPVTRGGRIDRGGFENGSSNAVCERSVNDVTNDKNSREKRRNVKGKENVRVTRDPADISNASEPVIWVDVEYVLDGQRRAEEVSCSSMDNSFGLACGARGLQNI